MKAQCGSKVPTDPQGITEYPKAVPGTENTLGKNQIGKLLCQGLCSVVSSVDSEDLSVLLVFIGVSAVQSRRAEI